MIEDLSTADNIPRLSVALACGLKSAFAFPVVDKDKVLGVFEFFSERPCDADSEILDMLQTLGKQIAQFARRKESECETQRLASVIQYSSDAIFTKSKDNVITSWNNGAERLLGYTAEEVRGKLVLNLIPPEKLREADILTAKIAAGERIDNFETQRVRKDGKLVDVILSLAPILSESDDFGGSSVTLHDITERKEAERRVSEFYSMVSHELRSPLTSIRGALGLIEGRIVEGGSPEAMDLIEVARGSSDRLIRLINDMLDLKKIECGKMELDKSDIDVEALVVQTLQALLGMAEASNIKLLHQTQAGASIYADWDKVTQILTNLVSNAIKFSPHGSEVLIDVKDGEPGQVRFSVIDNGPGISPDDMHKLFGKFQQLDSSDSRAQGGTGLGLAISKALVREHCGTIGVDSTPGSGSVFWFEMPEKEASIQSFRKILPIPVDNTSAVIPAEDQCHPLAIDVSEQFRILVVDDDRDTRKVLKAQLKGMGLRCIEARDGAEAIELARKYCPDLIVLDVIMPNEDGFKVVEVLSKEATAATPLIIYSGKDLSPAERKSLTLGSTRYLTKGTHGEFDLLSGVINALLEGARRREPSQGSCGQTAEHECNTVQ